ncbi:MAG TPA: 50S ribosomal protein L11 methyltransferase [Salinivirgaceae bacterium]|nr:50S ribosomal protein L11 methyltransferase [Salinivirgaceae bacterium]
MNTYVETSFYLPEISPELKEILIAELSDIGYESFIEENDELKCYIPREDFNSEILYQTLKQLSDQNITYQVKLIPRENWNQTWEANYEPVLIDDFCYIYASFHPQKAYPMQILVEPKMSFGTGHHPTTRLMIRAMRAINFENKEILDMGCGTGILSIAAAKLGAKHILGIDIDPWAVENCIENCSLNHLTNISCILGDAKTIDNHYDIILANINRNILFHDMEVYSNHLKTNGYLLLSGFFTEDENLLLNHSANFSLLFVRKFEEQNWSCMILQKSK